MVFGLFSPCPTHAQARFIGAEILEQDDAQLTYRIQYGAYSNADLRPQDLYARNDIECVLGQTGLTLHVGPPHADLGSAQREMEAARAATHEDAFLTAYLNGKLVATRVAVLDVARSQQPQESRPMNHRIQLGRYAHDLPVHMLNTFLNMGEVEQVREANGDHVYFTKVTSSEHLASAMLNRAKELGISDAFMVSVETPVALDNRAEAYAANTASH